MAMSKLAAATAVATTAVHAGDFGCPFIAGQQGADWLNTSIVPKHVQDAFVKVGLFNDWEWSGNQIATEFRPWSCANDLETECIDPLKNYTTQKMMSGGAYEENKVGPANYSTVLCPADSTDCFFRVGSENGPKLKFWGFHPNNSIHYGFLLDDNIPDEWDSSSHGSRPCNNGSSGANAPAQSNGTSNGTGSSSNSTGNSTRQLQQGPGSSSEQADFTNGCKNIKHWIRDPSVFSDGQFPKLADIKASCSSFCATNNTRPSRMELRSERLDEYSGCPQPAWNKDTCKFDSQKYALNATAMQHGDDLSSQAKNDTQRREFRYNTPGGRKDTCSCKSGFGRKLPNFKDEDDGTMYNMAFKTPCVPEADVDTTDISTVEAPQEKFWIRWNEAQQEATGSGMCPVDSRFNGASPNALRSDKIWSVGSCLPLAHPDFANATHSSVAVKVNSCHKGGWANVTAYIADTSAYELSSSTLDAAIYCNASNLATQFMVMDQASTYPATIGCTHGSWLVKCDDALAEQAAAAAAVANEPKVVAGSYSVEESLPAGTTGASLLSDAGYKGAKRSGLATALNVAEDKVTITGFTVTAARRQRQLKRVGPMAALTAVFKGKLGRVLAAQAFQVTTEYEIVVEGSGDQTAAEVAEALQNKIADPATAALVKTESDTAMAAAFAAGDMGDSFTEAPVMAAAPAVAAPSVAEAPTTTTGAPTESAAMTQTAGAAVAASVVATALFL